MISDEHIKSAAISKSAVVIDNELQAKTDPHLQAIANILFEIIKSIKLKFNLPN